MKGQFALSVGGARWLSRAGADPGWVRWGAHLAFWLVYFLFRTTAAWSDPPKEHGEFPFLLNRALVVGGYGVLTAGLLIAFAGLDAARFGRWRNWGLPLGALAFSPLAQYGEQLWPAVLAGMPFEPYPLAAYMFQFGWVLPLWGLMQSILGYHFQTMAQAKQIVRAQALAHDAQLKMLHYQINPHFLFNTLNAISTLVLEKRTEQAEGMLMRLSGFLRYSLDRDPNKLAPLADELAAQRKYLEIEQTRFGDKLEVRFEIEPGLDHVALPSLILQPILENAIKYAITPSTSGGRIDVSVKRDGDLVRIGIEDDGPGLAAENAEGRRGVGLANARERLELTFGARAGLSAQNRAARGCRIELWLPFEKEAVRERKATHPAG